MIKEISSKKFGENFGDGIFHVVLKELIAEELKEEFAESNQRKVVLQHIARLIVEQRGGILPPAQEDNPLVEEIRQKLGINYFELVLEQYKSNQKRSYE